ncbi:hypothetical protein BSZ39_10720 [Bowdeniella nasicola]|uniref:Uncharacterized protein n=1 Tax=Bowdeniella nasicola TaxID=208480 RepID=A0A1Q5Q0S7_9ACTO|nr:hypothetical protein [Bowdeniella nasicola]OKL53200.1 hypothetical protein BSZ39_10720 [Bowdeniella nasicola]
MSNDENIDEVFEQLMREGGLDNLGEEAAPEPKRRALAVILTPIASAKALAGLCAMSNLDLKVIDTSTGAVAAMEFVPEDSWSVESLTTGVSVPEAAHQAASMLSKTSRIGAVLVVVEVTFDEDGGQGTSGHMIARNYEGGEVGEDVSPGLVLANADDIVENLLLGEIALDELPEVHDSSKMSRLQAARLFMKGLRRGPQGGAGA